MAARVRLESPLPLISQAVAQALRSRGVDVVGPHRGRERPSTEEDPATPLLLIVDEPTTSADVRRALGRVSRHPGKVLALTGRSGGRFADALIASGAVAVMPDTASLDEVVSALERIAEGRDLVEDQVRRQRIHAWKTFLRDMRECRDRLATLSPRERTVLRALAAGASVSVIATRLDVAETTVRSQVKSVLRKLGVQSQLAAVALVRQMESPLVGGTLGDAPWDVLEPEAHGA